MKKIFIISWIIIIVIILLAINFLVINNTKNTNESNTTIPSSSSDENETNITSNITAYECLENSHCALNQSCVNNNCTNLNCTSCQFIENNSCINWECCNNSDCPSNQTCINHRCILINCVGDSECANNQICSDYQCTDLAPLNFETVEQGRSFGGVILNLKGMKGEGISIITNELEWNNFTTNFFKNSTTFTDFGNYFLISLFYWGEIDTNLKIIKLNQTINGREIIVYSNITEGRKPETYNDYWHIIKIKKINLVNKGNKNFIFFNQIEQCCDKKSILSGIDII